MKSGKGSAGDTRLGSIRKEKVGVYVFTVEMRKKGRV